MARPAEAWAARPPRLSHHRAGSWWAPRPGTGREDPQPPGTGCLESEGLGLLGTHATLPTRAREGRKSSGWPKRAGGKWGAAPHYQSAESAGSSRGPGEAKGAKWRSPSRGRWDGAPRGAARGRPFRTGRVPALEAARHAALGFRVPARPAARLDLPAARAWARGEGEGEGAAQAARPGGRWEACTAPARAASARGPAVPNRSLTALGAGRGGRGGGGRAERGGGGVGGGRHTKGREGGGGLIVRSPQPN